MKFVVLVIYSAHHDTENAFDYYESQQDELGQRFLLALNECYEKLKCTPYNFGYIPQGKSYGLRMIRLKKFPYSIVYEILELQKRVVVYAVHHHKKESWSQNAPIA